jgi:hypothetical protein
VSTHYFKKAILTLATPGIEPASMDQVMDGGRLPLEAWFWEMPTCTRWWTTATILMSALVQCQMVTPFQLFYSFRAVFVKSQVSVVLGMLLFPLLIIYLRWEDSC